MRIRRKLQTAFVFLLVAVVGSVAVAHPGSGIVVDRKGRVFFVDTGGGLLMIAPGGRIERYAEPRFHWLTIDHASRFANARALSTATGDITPFGTQPTLIVSSDFPVAIGSDGALYYPELERSVLRIVRVDPAGTRSVRAVLPRGNGGDAIRWLNGLAAGPDGSFYHTEDKAVRRIDKQGHVSLVAEGFIPPQCVAIPGVESPSRPYLRGLDVAPDGTVYVAASGCGSVLKITPQGKISPILHTASPWSPTAVALSGGDVYVLEYLHTATESRREWLPRVRKISRDGTISTVAAVPSR
jgi:sugar lactone lactonase YvrE